MSAADRPDRHEEDGRPAKSRWRRLWRAFWSAWGNHIDAFLRSCAYAYPAYLPVEPATHGCTSNDEQLCRRWRESGPRLAQWSSAAEILSVVSDRQRCLDELERRHPERFAAWLAGWPDSAADPIMSLSTEWVEVPSIPWHQLLSGGPDEGTNLRDPA